MTVWDRSASCYGRPLYQALWVRAWGDQYPANVAPYSSCTRHLLEQLREEIRVPEDGTLADLGCGAGGIGLYLAKTLCLRLEGVDCSSRAIEIARQRVSEWGVSGRANFNVGDFASTGLESGSADAVIIIDALPFADDIESALAETHRVLKTGGRLVFTTRETTAGTPVHARLGKNCRFPLARNGFEIHRVLERPEVSSLWRKVYKEWMENEKQLRTELPDEVVDQMVHEAKVLGPRLDEDRPWLLITAIAAGRSTDL